MFDLTEKRAELLDKFWRGEITRAQFLRRIRRACTRWNRENEERQREQELLAFRKLITKQTEQHPS